VYGTLKKGKDNHELLKGTIQMGEAQTIEEYAMFDLGQFPIVTEDEVSIIHGELYRIDEKVLKQTDELEGEWYDRIMVPIKLKDSGTVEAWMYVCIDDELDGILIREGKWR
jgi:gamma-glutamylcyclotransferase (GGCT)/AIG2-like uncharacterized protein YtfP